MQDAMQVQRFDNGEKQRYFADDDKQKLSDLVAQQRYEGAADMDANLADNIVRKGKRFRYSCRISVLNKLHCMQACPAIQALHWASSKCQQSNHQHADYDTAKCY